MGRILGIVLVGLAIGAGAALAWRLTTPSRTAPADPPAVVERIREVARLEALDVSLYKKVSFAPDPAPADSLWGDLYGWARHTLRPPRGKAIVFAEAHLGLDVSKLGPGSVRARGREVWIVLPPLRVTVELRPGETEVLGSNLDSAETAKLLELARVAFQREVEGDARLREKAVGAARRALEGLLSAVGYERVYFVERLQGEGQG
jgi:hypothetical protein